MFFVALPRGTGRDGAAGRNSANLGLAAADVLPVGHAGEEELADTHSVVRVCVFSLLVSMRNNVYPRARVCDD